MHINENTAVLTSRITLVPYEPHHVQRYHSWMQDEELQILTASEPLTLAEEHAMQQRWREDADKLTFIICGSYGEELDEITRSQVQTNQVECHDPPMLGDVNLFLYPRNDEEELDEAEDTHQVIGEVEIMIADPLSRDKGYGRRALDTFLKYIARHEKEILREHTGGQKHASLAYMRAKISATNTKSIRLFKQAGFLAESDEPNYFGEIEMRLPGWQNLVDEVAEKKPDNYLEVEYKSWHKDATHAQSF